MSYRAIKTAAVAGGLLLMSGTSLAQKAIPIEVMAEDAQMATAVKSCQAIVYINENEAKKLFKEIVMVMLDEYGKEKTDAALDRALQYIIDDMKKKGLQEWCEMDAVIWIEIRYPEIGRK